MWAYNNYDEIYHHGIKGMHWGIRKKENTRITKYDIPKGSTSYRAVRTDSKKFMKRKYTYVNNTDSFADHSINTSEGFDGEFQMNYKMKAKKPLKIATTEDYFNAVTKANKLNPNDYLKDVPNDVIEKGKYAIENNLLPHKLREGMGGNYQAMYKAVKYLKRKGYDGVLDPVDGARQERDGENPIAKIIFDPKKKMKIVELC